MSTASTSPSRTEAVSAIVLAGGRAQRLGGIDKGLIELAGKPLIAHVLQRLTPQVGDIVVSANRHIETYAGFGWPVVPDTESGYPGPLAGILAGGARARHDWLLVAPCDTPFLPDTLASGMLDRARALEVPLVRARDAEQVHYAIMLLHRSLLTDLADWLAAGEHRVRAWQARHGHADVLFDQPTWAFLNINTPEDLRQAGMHVSPETAWPSA